MLLAVDWAPLVSAVAALVIAVTPVLVALLWMRVHEAERRLAAGQQYIADRVNGLEARRAGVVRTRKDDADAKALADRGEGVH